MAAIELFAAAPGVAFQLPDGDRILILPLAAMFAVDCLDRFDGERDLSAPWHLIYVVEGTCLPLWEGDTFEAAMAIAEDWRLEGALFFHPIGGEA